MLKKEFETKLKEIGLTRQNFCDLTGLAYSSVSNWSDETKPIPAWVENFLKFYSKSKSFDDIKEIIAKFE
ncbi:hypothetical protein CIG2463D_1350 [Campylobacter iguaniorum]|uniref:hypothetical protein n=1 Tax=Campylobacter iguaniorum TaxID=1244531 RepID=UPI00073A0B56|nr:hypothetical protein [Campylobacter iguaniorum]ALV24919.1 hypothetical protein CIG2463D_1350 [Campylobacter iguaniorum]